jgi:hypothetical protein
MRLDVPAAAPPSPWEPLARLNSRGASGDAWALPPYLCLHREYSVLLPEEYYVSLLAWAPSPLLAIAQPRAITTCQPANPRVNSVLAVGEGLRVSSVAWTDERTLHAGTNSGHVVTYDVNTGKQTILHDNIP